MHRILVVDDDPYIRELISACLKDEGFRTQEAADGQTALRMLGQDVYDLVILDIMMPDMDGYEVCKKLRNYYELPVLMLTAKGETRDKVKGFQLGADDYLTKPFAAEELIVRVQALLKRYQIASSQTAQAGNLIVDKNSTTVTMQGRRTDIPLKEFELLFFLASYQGKTLTRDRLIEEVWGYDFDGNERTIDVHIGRLRERFPEAKSGVRIKTIRGLGYRLEVTEHAGA